MRELLSLGAVRTLAAATACVAAVCIAMAVVVLVFQVRDQDRELDCRATDAAALDVLRSQISLELSKGLVQVVREDDTALNATIERIEGLQVDLEAATERRRRTVERCQ